MMSSFINEEGAFVQRRRFTQMISSFINDEGTFIYEDTLHK